MNNLIENFISVIICTYSLDRFEMANRCIHSILNNKYSNYEIILVIDENKELKEKMESIFKGENKIIILEKIKKEGLSAARNAGINIAKGEIIAFIDDDAFAPADWLENLYKTFIYNSKIAIVGGRILPNWISKPNKIILNSAIAQGFYSFFDMGDELKEVNQIFGANFAINKKLLKNELFSPQFLLYGDDTDFCRRIRKNGLKIIYNPFIFVWHQIPFERTKFKWILKRVYYAGISRIRVGGMVTPKVVNYINYNLYDVLFLIIFIIPYLAGLFKALLDKFIFSWIIN